MAWGNVLHTTAEISAKLMSCCFEVSYSVQTNNLIFPSFCVWLYLYILISLFESYLQGKLEILHPNTWVLWPSGKAAVKNVMEVSAVTSFF